MLLFTLFKAIRLFFHPGNYFRIFTGSHHNRRHSILHSQSAYAGLLLNEGVHSMEQCSATCENNSSVYNICSHEEAYREVGSQAISYTTGVPAMIGAMMMLEGHWKRPGVWNMEEFDPDPFMEALNRYGLPWQAVER